MSDDEAKSALRALLDRYSPGSVLHLLADVMSERTEASRWGTEDPRHGRLTAVANALFVVGLGIDAARPE